MVRLGRLPPSESNARTGAPGTTREGQPLPSAPLTNQRIAPAVEAGAILRCFDYLRTLQFAVVPRRQPTFSQVAPCQKPEIPCFLIEVNEGLSLGRQTLLQDRSLVFHDSLCVTYVQHEIADHRRAWRQLKATATTYARETS